MYVRQIWKDKPKHNVISCLCTTSLPAVTSYLFQASHKEFMFRSKLLKLFLFRNVNPFYIPDIMFLHQEKHLLILSQFLCLYAIK